MQPAYMDLVEKGSLEETVAGLRELLAPCRLCPRECGVDRIAGETGFCRSGDDLLVASHGPHFGEEPPLVGTGGSGTIFLSNCNLDCIFCQNADISHGGAGRRMSTAALAQVMLGLQEMGCHNVNLVTPTHFAPHLVESVGIAARGGLRLPVVWNCGGYESVEALRLLDGIVDIYMPDAKYADAQIGHRLSGVPDYPKRMRAAIAEMHRQVGDLQMDQRGIATHGLLVRHLVLPGRLAGTAAVMEFIGSLSQNTCVNIMGQYRPCYRAAEVPEMLRRPTDREMREAEEAAAGLGAGLDDGIDF